MTELRISEAAALSIVEQADYYQQASDFATIQQWEEAVDNAMRSLLTLPERGAPCRFRTPALAGLRWIFVPGFPKHMVFYRYLSQESAIRVVHVLHGSRNLETILDDDH
ncbi:MAG: type II toxin-antitoxin system RelE/ParE family toxin [Terracidiphilus sp.]